jgi:hypothetical protein
LAPFPLPGLAELREQYTYNIHPFSDSHEKGSRSNLGNASSDEDDDDLDTESVGCLGVLLPFSEFATPPMKSLPEGEQPSRRGSDIAEASPGVFATDGYSPLPYTTRQFNNNPAASSHVNKEMSNLEKQYSKMRLMQQQAVVVFSEATVQNIQDADKKSKTPSAINHLFVSATKRKAARGKGTSNTCNDTDDNDDDIKAKQNTYERESMAHLKSLFKGNQKKEDDRRESTTKTRTNSLTPQSTTNKPKLEHMGLNGEICKLEAPINNSTPNGHTAVPLYPSKGRPANIIMVDNSNKSLKTPSSNVEILDKNSPSVMDSNQRTFISKTRATKSASTSLGSSSESFESTDNTLLKSWMVQEDQRCVYPTNFRPFPQRNKIAGRSKILYGNISDKGVKRKEAFQGKRGPRPPINGNCIPEESRS